jgi:hypothetical protein
MTCIRHLIGLSAAPLTVVITANIAAAVRNKMTFFILCASIFLVTTSHA